MRYVPLPTEEQTLLEITTSLDGEQFTIVYDWNSVLDRWSMRISDGSGNLIAAGITLVPSTPLLRPLAASNKPKGILMLQSVDDAPMTSSNTEECKLLYFEASEITYS